MSRFNAHKSTTNKTLNRAGQEAYVMTPELELVSILISSFIQDQFYRREDETITELLDAVDKVDPYFAAQAAVYARRTLGMRSTSHIVAAKIAHDVKGEEWTKDFLAKVVQRPDDMTEILAFFKGNGGGPVPNSMKKAFRERLRGFNEYKLAKYQGKRKEFSMVDLVNLVHPQPTEAIDKLMNGTLATPDTWETKLSAAGKSEDVEAEKQEAWRDLILEEKIGYLALLRNLRNILEQAPDAAGKAAMMLQDRERVLNSQIFPFQFYNAYRELANIELENSNEMRTAISRALDASTENLPRFEGKTLVAIDTSGSMDQGLNERGTATVAETALVLGASLAKAQKADVVLFASDAGYYNANFDDSTLTLVKDMYREGDQYGYGTNLNRVFDEVREKGRAYDRIFVLSDMQTWMAHIAAQSDFELYKKEAGGNPLLYSWDLTGYGSLQFPERNVVTIGGFSNKIFDLLPLAEKDKEVLINEVKQTQF